MGNSVSYSRRPDLPSLEMSNGHTSVFISTLSLAASRVALTMHEKELAVWFASRDQWLFGSGMVGFDLSEIPWSVPTFQEDKAFILRMIEAAKAKSGWDRLSYSPNEERIMPSYEEFAVLINAFVPEDIVIPEGESWSDEMPDPLVLCERHGVYQHDAGCVVCHDSAV